MRSGPQGFFYRNTKNNKDRQKNSVKLLNQGSSPRSLHMRQLTSYFCMRGETIIPGDPARGSRKKLWEK